MSENIEINTKRLLGCSDCFSADERVAEDLEYRIRSAMKTAEAENPESAAEYRRLLTWVSALSQYFRDMKKVTGNAAYETDHKLRTLRESIETGIDVARKSFESMIE